MSNSASQPVIVTRRMMLQALADPRFVTLLPAFGSSKALLNQVTNGKPVRAKGCAGCRGKRIAQSVWGQFVSVMLKLPPGQLTIFKQYFCIDRLMINRRIGNTGQLEVKIL